MSDPRRRIPTMQAWLEHLTDLAADDTRPDEYLDQLACDTVQLCRRPGDWQRVTLAIHELTIELANHRKHANAPTR